MAHNRKDIGHVAGGAFLLQTCGSHAIFTPENFGPDELELFRTAEKFVVQEVLPKVPAIEAKEPGVLVGLLKRAGELGFLAVDVPERYGGLGLSKTTSMLATEALRKVGSFSVTVGAHTGIGSLPLVFYGTEAQKQKYLPKLATGEWVAAYALTEAGSGSDALAAKTTATKTEKGFRLNGVKQWITNAAFADLFTVFAQVDGDKFTAFLVERKVKGVSVGPEEHKMGIRGSSTCEVILEDAEVPADAVLGEIGRGHKIAFNILNVGRLKLGIGTIGASKTCLELAVSYAKDRRQFGKAIVEFGLLRQKIGQMATRIYVGESMGYRTAGLIDRMMKDIPQGADPDTHAARVLEEYAIESSILKVYGSETLDFCADESLQIHGGYGFTEHFQIERISRDSRINRIFEGTNEINRLLIPAMLFKRAAKGELPLLRFVQKTRKMLAKGEDFAARASGAPLAHEGRAADVAKRVIGLVTSAAFEKYGPGIQERQEILGAIADMTIAAYGLDSAVTRTLQLIELRGRDKVAHLESMTRIYCHDAHEMILDTARLLAAQILEGAALEEAFAIIARLPERVPLRYFSEVESVAAYIIERGGYPATGP